MATFLTRLTRIANDRNLSRGRGDDRVVDYGDLMDIIHHFNRLDAEIRAEYGVYESLAKKHIDKNAKLEAIVNESTFMSRLKFLFTGGKLS